PDRFVGEAHMERIAVRLRIHRHRGNAQLLAGADAPQGDLPSIGDWDFQKHNGVPAISSGWDECQREAVRIRRAVRFPRKCARFPLFRPTRSHSSTSSLPQYKASAPFLQTPPLSQKVPRRGWENRKMFPHWVI